MEKIDIVIECSSCNGTGIYCGIGESKGTGVICSKCKGTGCYNFKLERKLFTKKAIREGIERFYLSGSGYKIVLGIVGFKGIGETNMNKEGASYSDFTNGKFPTYIKQLGCPMLADQGACHNIKGFVDHCNDNGLDWGMNINNCRNKSNKSECWKRFEDD